MFPKSLLFVAFLLLFTAASAQDTLSLFYETAKYRLTDDNRKSLTDFFERHDLAGLDSIQVIGVADSSGNIASNQRLSLRRATHVSNYLAERFLIAAPVRNLAKGEVWKAGDDLSGYRRVDVILFYPKSSAAADLTPDETLTEDDGFCYTVADSILLFCHRTIIEKGKKSYVQLEMEGEFYSDALKLYSVSEDPKTKKPVLRTVKWKPVKSGEDWWLRKRYIAQVKLDDFDRYRLVMRSPGPCDSIRCGFRMSDRSVSLDGRETYVYVDAFLMRNVKAHRRFFKRKEAVIEVPKQYVDMHTAYYYDVAGTRRIEWYTKRGKKHRAYYYANVPVSKKSDILEVGIYRKFTGNCYRRSGKPWSHYGGINCGTSNNRGGRGSCSGGIELGDRNIDPTHWGYIGLYAKDCFRHAEADALVALDTDLDPYLSLRYDFHYMGFSKYGAGYRQLPYSTRITALYAGATLNMVFPDFKSSFVTQDLHLGIDYMGTGGLHRIFLEAGVMADLTRFGQPLRPQYRLGIQLGL